MLSVFAVRGVQLSLLDNEIDVFRVFRNGTLSNPVANDSAGAVPFAAVFSPSGTLIVGSVTNPKRDFVNDFVLSALWERIPPRHLERSSHGRPGHLLGCDRPIWPYRVYIQSQQFDTLRLQYRT